MYLKALDDPALGNRVEDGWTLAVDDNLLSYEPQIYGHSV